MIYNMCIGLHHIYINLILGICLFIVFILYFHSQSWYNAFLHHRLFPVFYVITVIQRFSIEFILVCNTEILYNIALYRWPHHFLISDKIKSTLRNTYNICINCMLFSLITLKRNFFVHISLYGMR